MRPFRLMDVEEKIIILQQIHLNLYDTVKAVTSIHSASIVLFLFFTFTELITNAYRTFSGKLGTHDWQDLLLSPKEQCTYSLKILYALDWYWNAY